MSTLQLDRRLGAYEVPQLIGRGGMGAVYTARHATLRTALVQDGLVVTSYGWAPVIA